MVTRVIKGVGVFSFAKILGFIYVIFGIIIGAFITYMSTSRVSEMGYNGGGIGLFYGPASIILLPILYGIVGFIAGLLIAIFFNVATGYFGGLEVDLEVEVE